MKAENPAAAANTPPTVSSPELLVEGSDLAFRTFVHRLLAFSARLEAVRSGFASIIGLTGIQYTTLISIAHLQGEEGVGVTRIAEDLGLTGSFVTLVSGQLVKLGLVDKQPDEQDRRRVRLTVTAKGLQLLSDLAPAQAEVNDLLFRPLDKDAFRALSWLMGELIASGDEAVALVDYLAGGGATPASGIRER
ncbi:MAG: MarR family winged helix-turn-helix transcriptional regulator [Alphaproteobacteria bacterium]